MRYFLLPGAKTALTQGVVQAGATADAVAGACPAQRVLTGLLRTPVGAIDMAAIAATTQDHLAMTAGAVEKPCADVHRPPSPMSAGETGRAVSH
jgi:hypothetical protein